jgi:hypothetical protein
MFKNFLVEYDKIKIGTGLYLVFYILSASLYPFYQLGRIQVVLDNVFKKQVVNTNLIITVLILAGLSFFTIMGEEGQPTTFTETLTGLFGIVNFVICIIISFNISKEFEFLIIKEKIKLPEGLKFNTFFLIIFNIVYINYKFNQFLELELKK